ncbi:hypothetical protein AcV5_000323 [Taiwanofungus camphoratus]|nr:hypothetical protein AcV5_000323 [Antrodia cinnamomea]
MADAPLHELDFLFSVFYSHDEVSIFVNFPSVYFDNRIGELRWQFRCELVQKYNLTSKPTLRNLVTLYTAMLTVEQHTHLLRRRFEAIFRDPASTVLQEFATFKKNSENNSDSRPKPIQEEKPQDNARRARKLVGKQGVERISVSRANLMALVDKAVGKQGTERTLVTRASLMAPVDKAHNISR